MAYILKGGVTTLKKIDIAVGIVFINNCMLYTCSRCDSLNRRCASRLDIFRTVNQLSSNKICKKVDCRYVDSYSQCNMCKYLRSGYCGIHTWINKYFFMK